MATILSIADHVTAESIARAKAQQQADRDEVERVTGLKVTDTPVGARVTIVHCRQPGCRYAATAKREAQAMNSVAAHIVRVHVKKGH